MMKNFLFSGRLARLVMLLTLLVSAHKAFAGEAVREISTVEDWLSFVKSTSRTNCSLNGKLMADIYLGKECSSKYIVGYSSAYLGEFDGNGHTITIDWDDSSMPSVGLFSWVKGATIKNLHVSGTLKAKKGYAAGLVTHADDNTVISNCTSDLEIESEESVAGLAYWVEGKVTINNCLVAGKLKSNYNGNVDGFVGLLDKQHPVDLVFNNCLFTADNNGDQFHYTFCNPSTKQATLNYCYYSQKCGNAQGIGIGTEDLRDLGALTLLNKGDGNWAQVVYGNCPEPYTPGRENVKNYLYKGSEEYQEAFPRWATTKYNCHSFYFDESKDWKFSGIPYFHCDEAESSRKILDQVYSTVCLPWGFNVANETYRYYFKRLDKTNNRLVFNTVTGPGDPYKPYMIYGPKGVINNMNTKNTFVYTQCSDDDLVENGNSFGSNAVEDKGIFRGTTTMISNADAAKEHLMVLQAGGVWKYITAAKPTSYVPAWRCYFKFNDETVQSKDFRIAFEDETTGISTISNEELGISNSDAYNLAGQKVSKGYKGIVIQNGKKIVK